MPVIVGQIEGTKINCLIWIGRVSRSEALEFPGRIDPSLPEFGRHWISYFDLGADLSDLDAACLLEVRERLRPVVSGLAAKGGFRMILVSKSKYNNPLLAAWQAMTATDTAYPSDPALAPDILAAACALGLSAEDAERARVWIHERIERPMSATGL